MKTIALILLVLAALPAAQATLIYSGVGMLTGSDPTQDGRMFRSGVPSDWSAAKAYPGWTNIGTSYVYQVSPFLVSWYHDPIYWQISVDDPSVTVFASAYAGSYDPASPMTGYLGDAGFSGITTFQVITPADIALILVVNAVVSGSGGMYHPFYLVIEAFADQYYTDIEPIPEPGTYVLAAGALGLMVLLRRKRPSK